nr:hypothetical protein [Kibdelosporangium sp. MJ126-NF4]CTQ89961.1 hypothetical protein [Kibdelosporangium sp. MJ126-NF4]
MTTIRLTTQTRRTVRKSTSPKKRWFPTFGCFPQLNGHGILSAPAACSVG